MIDDPNNIFQASVAMTQFASAAMATYSAVNSIKNAFPTLTDVLGGNASAVDTVVAGVSSLLSSLVA